MPDIRTLDLIVPEESEFDKWIAAFKTCGMYYEDTPVSSGRTQNIECIHIDAYI